MARFFLVASSISAFLVSLNLFYKLPKAGSGVYLLCGASVVVVVYCFLCSGERRKKKMKLWKIFARI
jgi:hypothetical protein